MNTPSDNASLEQAAFTPLGSRFGHSICRAPLGRSSVLGRLADCKFMSKIFFNALLGLVCVASAGCASTFSRVSEGGREHPEPLYFVGVRFDYDIVFHPSEFDKPRSIVLPLCAIDMPMSFCADIFCLPYDLYTAHAYHTWKAGMTNTPFSFTFVVRQNG